ncbi:MAG: hypothetical protein ACJ758_05405 [Actinomycetota bacterium]
MLVAGGFLAWVAVRRFRHSGFPNLPLAAAGGVAFLSVAVIVTAFIVPRKLFPGPTVFTPGAARPASTAHLTIVKPPNGERVSGSQLEVVLRLTGGTIVQTTTTNIQPNTGHIHLSVDGRLISMTYGVLQSVDLSSLSAGKHTLTAQFVAADHGPFNPPVVASTTFVKDG